MAASERLSLLLEARTTGEQDLQRFEQAINRVVAASEKANEKKASGGPNIAAQFGDIKAAVTDPLSAAGDAAERAVLKFGKVGLVAGGVAVGLGVVGLAAFKLVDEMGRAAEGTVNLADRLGVTVNQADRLQAMAKIAGVSIDALEGSSRIIAATLEDTSGAGAKAYKAFEKLGIAVYDATGSQREMGAVTIDLIEKLSQVGSNSERVTLAQATLGKAAKELQPLIKNYDELKRSVEAAGVGFDEYIINRLAGTDDKLGLVGIKWDLLRRKMAVPISAVVDVVLDWANSNTRPVGGGVFGGGLSPDRNMRDAASLSHGGGGQRQLASLFLEFSQRIPQSEAAAAFTARALRTPEGLQSKLQDLTKGIAERSSKLSSPDISMSARAEIQAEYNKLQQEKAAVESRIKEMERLKAAESGFAAFRLKIAAEADMSPFISPRAKEMQAALREYRGVKGSDGAIAQMFQPLLAREQQDILNLARGKARTEAGRVAEGAESKANDPITRASEDYKKLLGETIAKEEQALAFLKQNIDGANQYAKQRVDHQARMIELLAGPGGELEAIAKIAQLRYDGANSEAERVAAVFDYEERIAELRKNQRQANREGVGKLFDAAVAGGGGIQQLALSTITSSARTVAMNVGDQVFDKISKSFQLPGQVKDGKLTGLGKALQGTFFGADPVKIATDLNTVATQANTAALLAVGGGAAAVGGFGSILNGVTQNPLIFNSRSTATGVPFGVPQITGIDPIDGHPVYAPLPGASPAGGAGKYANLGRAIGITGAAAGAGYGVYRGVKEGGIGGAVTATGAVAGGAAGILAMSPTLAAAAGPAAPFVLAGIALAAPLIHALLPDKRVARDRFIGSTLDRSRYEEPSSISYDTDTAGNSLDYDRRGQVRVYVTQNIQAMDAKSFMDRRQDIAEATRQAMAEAHPLNDSIRGVSNPI
jgi:hypothetical protein